MPYRRVRIGSAALVAGLTLTGCAGTDDGPGSETQTSPDPETTVTVTATTTATPGDSVSPSSPASSGDDSPAPAPGNGNQLPVPTNVSARTGVGPATAPQSAMVKEVRVGQHKTFDRVVIDFAPGSALPSYEVSWVPANEQLRAPGSGQAVALAGDRVLKVTLQNARNRDPATVEPALPAVREVHSFGSFEAVASLGIGVATGTLDEVGFRVTTIAEGPPRLVIDVAHADAYAAAR